MRAEGVVGTAPIPAAEGARFCWRACCAPGTRHAPAAASTGHCVESAERLRPPSRESARHSLGLHHRGPLRRHQADNAPLRCYLSLGVRQTGTLQQWVSTWRMSTFRGPRGWLHTYCHYTGLDVNATWISGLNINQIQM